MEHVPLIDIEAGSAPVNPSVSGVSNPDVGICRICFEEESLGNLESPCACSGTLKVNLILLGGYETIDTYDQCALRLGFGAESASQLPPKVAKRAGDERGGPSSGVRNMQEPLQGLLPNPSDATKTP